MPWRSRTVQIVFLATLLTPFSVALISPGLPVFRTVFRTTDAGASLLLAAILLPGVALSPLVDWLADRIGRRRGLVSGLVLWSLAGGVIIFRPPFSVILALRVLQGTALAVMALSTIALLGAVFEDVQRNAELGANTAVLSAGAAVFLFSVGRS